MAENLIQFGTRKKGEVTILDLSGRLDRTTAPETKTTGEKIIDENKSVVMNMEHLEYISSAGLRVILHLAKSAEKNGKEFALCSPVGIVKNVLEEASIDVFVTVYKTEDEI